MLKPIDKGGFDGARDAVGNVLISESALRKNWPNHVVPMTKRYKAMCVCDKCGVAHEVHDSVKFFRTRLIKKLSRDVSLMNTSRSKDALKKRIKKYESDIMDSKKVLKMNSVSLAADTIACDPIDIDGISVHKFACVIGKCTLCEDQYKPILFEASCDEKIKYCLYVGHHQCTWHGDGYLQESDGNCKYECTKCMGMSKEEKDAQEKKKKPAKINTKKFKTKYSESMNDFVKKVECMRTL